MLQIKQIKLYQTEQASFHCEQCPEGTFSIPGSSECSLCGLDEFLNEGTGECQACTGGKRSIYGTIAYDEEHGCFDCGEKFEETSYNEILASDDEDLRYERFSVYKEEKCVKQEKDGSYQRLAHVIEYKNNLCSDSQTLYNGLIVQNKKVDCRACSMGNYYRTFDGIYASCEPCPDGTALTMSKVAED